MEDPRIISALFIFLKMAYYNVLINRHDYCCIECLENEVCKEQCARMDRYEYCVECPEYEEVE